MYGCFLSEDGTNLSSFLTPVILEGTLFLVKTDSFKSRPYLHLLKFELAYFVMSSGGTHLNWSSLFEMVNLFKGC